MIKVDKLNPFGRMCVSLGMIPSSYKESLTYEEQILWFMNYLEKTVTPALNNNADAIIELQGLYEQIKTYVDEYFDNLVPKFQSVLYDLYIEFLHAVYG